MNSNLRALAGSLLLLSSTLCVGSETVPGILPSGMGAEVDRDVAALRKATSPFHTIDAALGSGYEQETECMEKPPEGGMGYHFTKRELRDGKVELEKPEVLVYEKRADGTFKLNGVEYIVPISAWPHTEAPTVMGQPLKRFDRGGFWYLHAWVWEHSPSGLFADWNPRVKCAKAMNH